MKGQFVKMELDLIARNIRRTCLSSVDEFRKGAEAFRRIGVEVEEIRVVFSVHPDLKLQERIKVKL